MDPVKESGMVLSAKSPQQTHIFNGGSGFFGRSPKERSDLYSSPLELPNVLVLPLHSFVLQAEESERKDVYPLLVSKLGDDGALLIHNKFRYNTCANQQCWPFKA